MTRIVTLLFSLSFALFANAVLYQWEGENGQLQFSDEPPPDGVPFVIRDQATLPHVHRMQSVKPGTIYPDTRHEKRAGFRGGVIGLPERLGDKDKPNWDCAQVKRNLEAIEDRMRKGYSWNEGVRLREKRQKYRDYYYNECR